ncbi:hypothetical protein DERF_008056 [Dermatophagoides farinae]|uniref:Uncharacterized protein n=1 Tax=Dermatophagoides farinae TaxID=6954 RepID=A0A922L3W3_DERFA|nr:hypothetical protein DERF_008056 [Dermatophagoides farinae]
MTRVPTSFVIEFTSGKCSKANRISEFIMMKIDQDYQFFMMFYWFRKPDFLFCLNIFIIFEENRGEKMNRNFFLNITINDA